jgi:hypothetical protein
MKYTNNKLNLSALDTQDLDYKTEDRKDRKGSLSKHRISTNPTHHTQHTQHPQHTQHTQKQDGPLKRNSGTHMDEHNIDIRIPHHHSTTSKRTHTQYDAKPKIHSDAPSPDLNIVQSPNQQLLEEEHNSGFFDLTALHNKPIHKSYQKLPAHLLSKENIISPSPNLIPANPFDGLEPKDFIHIIQTALKNNKRIVFKGNRPVFCGFCNLCVLGFGLDKTPYFKDFMDKENTDKNKGPAKVSVVSNFKILK